MCIIEIFTSPEGHAHLHTHLHVHIHVYVYVCVYLYVHVHVYVNVLKLTGCGRVAETCDHRTCACASHVCSCRIHLPFVTHVTHVCSCRFHLPFGGDGAATRGARLHALLMLLVCMLCQSVRVCCVVLCVQLTHLCRWIMCVCVCVCVSLLMVATMLMFCLSSCAVKEFAIVHSRFCCYCVMLVGSLS